MISKSANINFLIDFQHRFKNRLKTFYDLVFDNDDNHGLMGYISCDPWLIARDNWLTHLHLVPHIYVCVTELVWITVCCLFGAMPLSKLMKTSHIGRLKEQTSLDKLSKISRFSLTIAPKCTVCKYPPSAQIVRFMGPTWGPPGSCRPQMGPMSAPWTLLSGWFCW